MKDEVLEKQIQFWKDALADVSFVLELPTDYQRPSVATFRGGVIPDVLGVDMTEQLKKLVKVTNSTMFMVLMAAFQILLYRYSDQKTFFVGTPIANRNKLEIENLIGFFVNTLAIKADFNDDPNFLQLIQQIKNFSLGAYEHQDLPFEMLVDKIQPERDLSHTPIFQV